MVFTIKIRPRKERWITEHAAFTLVEKELRTARAVSPSGHVVPLIYRHLIHGKPGELYSTLEWSYSIDPPGVPHQVTGRFPSFEEQHMHFEVLTPNYRVEVHSRPYIARL